eukprot:TRINITY_DN28317_c0_g1_i1.p1 TRINITY_DN28317_c0_g1~~TRINITY_DN28317_c0_g1_i1.p1  ORF type:complete len:684 (+),score=42.00 TRINITY_DN28317_c0_g1_i1:89-2140(+)
MGKGRELTVPILNLRKGRFHAWILLTLVYLCVSLNPSCWPAGARHSPHFCCYPYSKSGLADCWVDGLNFETCCVPESRVTATHVFAIFADGRETRPLQQLSGIADVSVFEGGRLQISWHVPWSCPPAAAHMISAHTPCGHRPDGSDDLWTLAYVLQTHMASYAQTSPHNVSSSHLFAAGLRLAASVAELRCILRHRDCVVDGWNPEHVLDEMFAILDLLILELSALGLQSVDRLVGPHGLRAELALRGDNIAEIAMLLEGVAFELLSHLDANGLPRWQFSGYRHLSGVEAASRGGHAVLVHPILPPEFAPSCAALTRAVPLFLGAHDSPSITVTGGLSWHLDISVVMESIGAESEGGVVVNLGAEDGGCHESPGGPFWMYDPANCLVERHGWGGVLIEGNLTTYRSLKRRMSSRRNVLCSHAYIEPSSVLRTIQEAGPCNDTAREDGERVRRRLAEGDVDLLKIDLDFGDCDFVEALMVEGGLRPRAVHVEVNPLFPPPFAFRQRFSEALLWSRGDAGTFIGSLANEEWRPWRIGCSLSAYHAMLGGPDAYVIAQVQFHDVLFVRKDLAGRLPLASLTGPSPSPTQLWLQGFHCDPLRAVIRRDDEFAGFDFRRWAQACAPLDGTDPSEEALRDVELSMNSLLRRDGGFDVGVNGDRAAQAPRQSFPYSLWSYSPHVAAGSHG